MIEGREDAPAYTRIVLALLNAGAKVKREWIDDDRLRADAAFYSALLNAVDPG